MAAPNIVNVVSIYGKTALASVATTETTVLSNPASSNKVLKINSIYVSNIDGTNTASISVYVTRSSTQYYIAYTIAVPGDSMLDLINRHIYLEEGDTLYALASAAGDLQIVCGYEDIS